MGDYRFGKRLLIFLLSLSVSVSAILGAFGKGSIVYAAYKGKAEYRTHDLVRASMPEEYEADEVVVGGLRTRVLNGKNLNTGVSTGSHYEYLDETEKIIYRALVAASSHVFAYGTKADSVKVGDEGLVPVSLNMEENFGYTQQQYQNTYEAVRYDHPDLIQLTLSSVYFYYLPVRYSSSGEVLRNSYLYMVSSGSYYTQQRFNQMTQEMRDIRSEILADASITGAKGIIGRELAVHDKLMEINTYDDECYAIGSPEHIGHTAYGALVRGTSVCDGYAMAYSYLLDGMNVDALVIGGYANGGGHAWNIVRQYGEWYEVDVTWDDQDDLSNASAEFETEMRHVYYHLTTEEISNHRFNVVVGSEHHSGSSRRSRDGCFNLLPVAEGTAYNWDGVKAAISGAPVVAVPVTDVEVNVDSITEDIGTIGQIVAQVVPDNATNQVVHFKSSDEDVIVVDEDGNYRIVGFGQAVVTAVSDDGGYFRDIQVNIPGDNGEDQVSGIVVSPGMMECEVGNTGLLEYEVSPQTAFDQSVTVSVSDENVLTVSEMFDGALYFSIIGVGTSVITIRTNDGGYEGTCIVRVPGNDTPVPDNNGGNASDEVAIGTKFSLGSDTYEVIASDCVAVVSDNNKKVTKVSVGDTVVHNGKTYRVTEIKKNVYKNRKKLKSVSIGGNVEKIGANAFRGCKNLKKIRIKANKLRSVGNGSFKGIKDGAKITVICKDKKTYNKVVKKLKKAGAKKGKFKLKKG